MQPPEPCSEKILQIKSEFEILEEVNVKNARKPTLIGFQKSEYYSKVTELISEKINSIINKKGRCRVMLTGGRTAHQLYSNWFTRLVWDHSKVSYFFGDERCVPSSSGESNYRLVMSTLFPGEVPEGCTIDRIRGEAKELHSEAARYGSLLDEPMDVLLLSVGEDGHIASLFPGDEMLSEYEQRVVQITAYKSPFSRITITPKVIFEATNVIVLAVGREKGRLLSKALEKLQNNTEIPVRIAQDALWYLDEEAVTALLDGAKWD